MIGPAEGPAVGVLRPCLCCIEFLKGVRQQVLVAEQASLEKGQQQANHQPQAVLRMPHFERMCCELASSSGGPCKGGLTVLIALIVHQLMVQASVGPKQVPHARR